MASAGFFHSHYFIIMSNVGGTAAPEIFIL